MQPPVKKITQGIIKYLAAADKMHWLPDIIRELEKKARQLKADNKALVASTYKLNSLEIGQIEKALYVVFNKKLKVVNVVDHSLIGGLKISVQDRVIDFSLDKTLSTLKSKISND